MKAVNLVPAAILLSVSVTAVAEDLDCQSIGESPVRFEVSIDPKRGTASILLPDYTREISELIVEEDRYYFYDLVPGARDERVETRRMFRYEKPGKVFYMDHDADIYLHGDCTKAGG